MDFFKQSDLVTKANNRSIINLFNDPSRVQNFTVKAADLFLDYSKQNIDKTELSALIEWAEGKGLSKSIHALFSGKKINNTENRAVLHSVLRAPSPIKEQTLGDLAKEVIQTEQQMAKIVDDVCQGQFLGVTGKKITDVLAIGIGGSYYGIKVGLSALKPYCTTGISVHVLANIDGAAVEQKLQKLNAETTLVIVISKTFTTQETMLNAKAVKDWMLAAICSEESIKQQWFAVSTNINAVTKFGLQRSHILPMWDWVGGRFSIWSAVGLPLALAIGNENFTKFKQGAHSMDLHFQSAAFDQNMPVLIALIGIWNRNALNYPSLAVLPYEHALRALPGYLQQTDMESNGKSVSKEGKKLSWKTAPVVFGQEGTNGQHAFMQLMHQSDDIIPTDFIVALKGSSQYEDNHKVLVANCFAQSEALMQGKTLSQATNQLLKNGLNQKEAACLAPHKTMKGNTPSNTLVMNKLTPETLGALLALYEHKIFVQGIIWQVNSYDQWGVELGKKLGDEVLSLMDDTNGLHSLSASTVALINIFTKA